MAQGPVVVAGESLIDVVRRPDGSEAEHVGGSPMNVAVGLGRLGRAVRLLTAVGDDAHGRMVLDHLAASSVETGDDVVHAAPTATAAATLDDAGGATYAFDIDDETVVPVTGLPAAAFHTGSIAAGMEPGATTVRDLVASYRDAATITYDPNARPTLMAPAGETVTVVERLVALSDVVKASDEDVAWLYPGRPVAEVARDWLALGPALVLVTLGPDGSAAWTTEHHVAAATAARHVVDTVGAGDAFMAGVIDALAALDLLGADRREALHALTAEQLEAVVGRATRIAGLTVERPGADPPTADDAR